MSLVFIGAAIAVQFAFPALPPLITLFPSIVLSALAGGRLGGGTALAIGAAAGYWLLHRNAIDHPEFWPSVSLMIFMVEGLLIIFVVVLLDTAVSRLQHERTRLDTVLRAAKASTWELRPNGKLSWDENFYRLVGLEPGATPPSTAQFLSMVHPDDRHRLAEARKLMDLGLTPKEKDEYRLIRPDGATIWLENHRVSIKGQDHHYLGITQDITTRKEAEQKITILLQELSHRAKNQFAVIIRMGRETYQQSKNVEEFDELFRARMLSMAKAQDLLVQGGGSDIDVETLLQSHAEVFGVSDRFDVQGTPVRLGGKPAQYLSMAFHELCTNAVKYGALSKEGGRVSVTWRIEEQTQEFKLVWRESGGPKPVPPSDVGFGSLVLMRLTPAAFLGKSDIEWQADGIVWTLHGPSSGLTGGAPQA